MAITPIQNTREYTKQHVPYNKAEGDVSTEQYTKPLLPEGHLVTDTFTNKIKYFFYDIAYDIDSVKNGLKGTAKDHQLGRLNDVGLKLGGVGIATVLAARTSNPMMRIMEYVGLGTFLAMMNIFPKVAINTPAKVIHGFNIGKEYIDDQGRKKSVFQDSNYIPFDMYIGETPGTDLDIIGDKMGIPRDIHNRHDIIKAQMRKIATQNNTWWMLTAGLATPILTALSCCGLEKIIAPLYEKVRNNSYNSKISKLLEKTSGMKFDLSDIKPNKLEETVSKMLTGYRNQNLPKEELDYLLELFTEKLDSSVSDAIKADIKNILTSNKASFLIEESFANDVISVIQNKIPKNNKKLLERVFLPTTEEISNIVKKYDNGIITLDDIKIIKSELRNLLVKRIQKESVDVQEFLTSYLNKILEDVSSLAKQKNSYFVSENAISDISNFARIMGDFKANDALLDACKSFKIEHAPETVLARGYAKFESVLLDVLGIKYKDLQLIRDSREYAKEILDKKLTELVSDESRYQKAVEKLSKAMSELEVALHGKSEETSYIKDLITAIENNYNGTAKRLNNIGNSSFKKTISALVFEDVATLANSLESRGDLFDILDGIKKPRDLKGLDYVKENAKGVGSAKERIITRIIERYQGAENSFRRVMHLFDFYRQGIPQGKYEKEVFELAKEALLEATSSQHTLKLNTVNNPELYRDIMEMLYGRGINESTKKALEAQGGLSGGNILARLESYLKRFMDIIGNNNIDFQKPAHKINESELGNYGKSAKTRMAKFNLVSQNISDFVQNAAEKRYGSQRWLRVFSIWGAAILGGTVLAQFTFGKIDNPHKLKKQVNDVNS